MCTESDPPPMPLINSRLPTLALTIGALSIAACSNDKQAAEDVLAEDSTLALDVMSARGVSITVQPPDTTSPSAADTPVAAPSTSIATNPAPSKPIALNTIPAEPQPTLRFQLTIQRASLR